jgi:hypothetical protein
VLKNTCYYLPIFTTGKDFKMAKITVHAGDWADNSTATFSFGSFQFMTSKFPPKFEGVAGDQLEMVDIATEDNVKKLAGSVGWGIAGGVVFGPVGALAGLILGGKKKEVTFVAVFKDGRKVLATADSKTYIQIQALTFKKSDKPSGFMAKLEAAARDKVGDEEYDRRMADLKKPKKKGWFS